MYHVVLFMYQLIGLLAVLAMPTAMLFAIIWCFVKFTKGFVRSITK